MCKITNNTIVINNCSIINNHTFANLGTNIYYRIF